MHDAGINNILNQEGHVLNLRTVTCLKRIIVISDGKGAMLGALANNRLDHQKSVLLRNVDMEAVSKKKSHVDLMDEGW